MIVPQDFQNEGFKNKQLGVIKFGYPTIPTGRKKCWS